MFSIDDDFDVDEDFLKNAFESEQSSSKKPKPSEADAKSSAKPLRNLNNNALINAQEDSPLRNRKNAEFLNQWNSNEERQFFSTSPPKNKSKNLLDRSRALSPPGYRTEVATRQSVSSSSKHVRQRKFPGPAGLLPERTCNTSFIAAEEYLSNIENEDDTKFEDKEVLSQASNKLFEEPGSAWRTMVEDLGPQGVQLIDSINLGSVRVKQARFGFKVPFLAVSVHNVDCSLPDPSLLLKDKIDEMHGTLHRDVWEEWRDEIVVGSVLVLRNTGVISAGTSARRFFLNITANNIATIYTPKTESGIKITQIQSSSGLNSNEILEEWERVMNQTRQQQLGPVESHPGNCRSLYNSSFSLGTSVGSSSTPSSSPSFSVGRPFTPGGVRPAFHGTTSSPGISSRSSTPLGRTAPNPFGVASPSPNFSAEASSRPFTPPSSKPTFRPRVPSSHFRTPNPQPNFSNSSPRPLNPSMNSNLNLTRPRANAAFRPRQPNQTINTHLPRHPNNTSINVAPQTFNGVLKSPKNDSDEIPSKKPKITQEISKPSTSNVFSINSQADQSLVDSVLDGIDTDLLFDDF